MTKKLRDNLMFCGANHVHEPHLEQHFLKTLSEVIMEVTFCAGLPWQEEATFIDSEDEPDSVS